MNLTLPGGIFTILLIDLLNGDSRTPIRGTGDAVAFCYNYMVSQFAGIV